MDLASVFSLPVGEKLSVEREWPPQGKWTYEDYRSLPDDGWRYEVIQGKLYASPASEPIHQECSGNLLAELVISEKETMRAKYTQRQLILCSATSPLRSSRIFVLSSNRGWTSSRRNASKARRTLSLKYFLLQTGSWIGAPSSRFTPKPVCANTGLSTLKREPSSFLSSTRRDTSCEENSVQERLCARKCCPVSR